MKKLVFAIAAVVAISFASCGGNTQNAEAVDSLAVDSSAVEEVVACDDSCECPGDSAIVEAVEEVVEAVAE